MPDLYPYQREGVRFLLGQKQVPCTGLECPMCQVGLEAKQRVVMNARKLGKTRLNDETFRLSMNRGVYDKILAIHRVTRSQRVTNFFRRKFQWVFNLLHRIKTSKN